MSMMIIFLIIFIVMMILSMRFRMVVCHPISCLQYALKDVFLYFKQHRYDWYEGGHMCIYEALFGGGKTLTMVHDIMKIYHRYHNKRVFDRRRGIWVTQKVLILSNVEIKGCEGYQHLAGLKQFVECAKHNEVLDIKNNTRTIVLGGLDEASVQLNSRSFKSNIDYGFLNVLLTCRHYAIDFYLTSQKTCLVDKLLRDVTQKVIHCSKKWRLVVNTAYDAREVERVGSLTLLQPLYTTGFFCTDADYGAYDTYAVVENLEKAVREGDMLSEAEILANRGDFYTDIESIERPSKRLKRLRRSK